MRHQPPHLTSPCVLWQSMGAPTAGRGTAKESGFDEGESLTALPSWKARFQFPLPAHRLRGGLFCLCGERLGEGNCHHLMQRERTHFPDEPKEGGSKRRPQICAIFYPKSFTNHQTSKSQPSPPQNTRKLLLSCLTNAASAPSPNLSPRPVAEHGITHRGERD
jgi:hypothetical protein